jgi:predicted N-acetyltransferase YhbS
MDWAFVAEDADAYQDLSRSVERYARPEVVLIHGPTGDAWSNLATRIRFGHSGLAGQVGTVRDWFAARSVEAFRWLVGSSATPPDLLGGLLELGASRVEAEPELMAMVLDHAPPRVAGVPVREVKSRSDFADVERIRRAVFGDGSTATSEELDAGWSDLSSSQGSRMFLAEIGGRPVAYGVMRRTDRGPWLLAGGVTLPESRGHGAYRALVRERWDAAVGMGAPALVTQAQAASRPILERLGFRSAASIAVLIDHSGATPSGQVG